MPEGGTRVCQEDGTWDECDCSTPFVDSSGGTGGSETGTGGAPADDARGVGGVSVPGVTFGGAGGEPGGGGAAGLDAAAGFYAVAGSAGSPETAGAAGTEASAGSAGAAGQFGLGGAPASGGAAAVAGSAGAANGGVAGEATSAAQGCLESGGHTDIGRCCTSVSSYPDMCSGNPCTCSPVGSHFISVCVCPDRTCFDGFQCVPE